MSLDSHLSRFLTVPGAIAAAFLDPQGAPVAQVGNTEAIEVLAAFQSVWLGDLARAASRAGLPEVDELLIDFEERRVLAAVVVEGYFLLVVLERDGLAARARALLPEIREQLVAEFA